MKKLLSVLAIGFLGMSSAQAAVGVNVLGGLNFQNDSVDPQTTGTTTSAKGAVSYGATAEFAMNPMMGLEVGLFSMTSKTKYTTGSGDYTISAKSVMIPVMARFNALPVLDIGVGGYYAILPSKVTIEDSTVSGLSNGEITATSIEKGDYGLRVGARAKFPVAPMFKVLVDATYNLGLKDTDKTSTTTEKTRGYTLMAGVSIGI